MCHDSTVNSTFRMKAAVTSAGLAVFLLAGPAALADDAPNLLKDPFQVAIGTFAISSEPTIQLNGQASTGDRVNFDEAIGGGDAQRVRLDGTWRFGDSEKHKLRLVAFSMSRDNSRTFDEEIEWGDDVYPVDARIDAEFKFSVVELAYEYAFLRRDNYELGASIGLHYTTMEASLKAKAEFSGGTLSGDIDNEASVDAPLPVIGLRGLWGLGHDFWVDASAQYFALSIDEYDGNLQDYRLLVTWQPKKWLGIGAGYSRFKIDVDVEKENFDGSMDWTYSGPMIFYSASF
jgi:hypothetical protein